MEMYEIHEYAKQAQELLDKAKQSQCENSNYYSPYPTYPVYPSPCPGCGRCPVCGRGGHATPYYEPYKITYTCGTQASSSQATQAFNNR